MLNINLNQALISEIIAHVRRGELNYCYQLGFDESELATIMALTTEEICEICDSSSSFASIKINHSVFWNLIESVRVNSQERNIIDRALNLGISGEMLRHRFGWSSSEVSARRKLLGIKEHIGRKRSADEQDELKVWELWQENKHTIKTNEIENSMAGLDLLMHIAEETELSLTEVWRLVSTWVKEGK
ncbi:DUF2857 domain-containing protein [Rodentibacter haemolyticus]|uniref:DUF2857 domain-containing protein n=1 Tax=Rodentibacter haemolyticus TaxID=2778911 RepID=A0ABX6UY34_9PAST|nr:DUF2857 domain-containing protein [Rodentibacter haemolyticus]QPB42883.1 DUF2857 domain-containing protein [Rodentibacter haemolyticus]